jgi:D-alanyl-D-alanine carboxypeptidase
MNPSPASRSKRLSRAFAIGVVAATLVGLTACSSDDDTDSAPADSAADIATTDASATSDPGTSDGLAEMGADDQAVVDTAITDGIARINAIAPQLEPPAFWVGVWDPAKGAYLTAQGDAAEGQPATVEDHFRIGSITKTYTGAIIMQMIEEGSVALDDTVGSLLPDLAADHPEIAEVTVESLLNMTSRIEDYFNVPDGILAEVVADPTKVWEPEEMVAGGLRPGLLPEGTVRYSTTNFIILQMIAEKIDGAPLGEILETRISQPLGLTATSYPLEDPSMPDPFAAGHINSQCVDELTRDGATGVDESTDPTDWSVSSGAGGGGFTSTLADLGKWADSMSGNSLLDDELQAARLETTSEIEPGVPVLYGLGIYQLGDGWYGHDGETIGWQAIELHNPDTGVSVAIAGNSCAAVSLYFYSILNELYPDEAIDAFLTEQGAIPLG